MTTRLADRPSMAVWLALGLIGCGEGLPAADDTDLAQSAVVNGTFTTQQHPEVARFNGNCAATLIGSRDFLTAARCIADQTNPPDSFSVANYQKRGGNLRFITPTPCTSNASCQAGFICDEVMGFCARNFTVDRTFPQGTHLGGDDLAVGRLTEVVPNTLAAPATISTTQPAPLPTKLMLVGFGCFRRDLTDFGIKRFLMYSYSGGNSSNYCPGDFGGPTYWFSSAGQQVVRVASTIGPSGNDVGADAVTFQPQILAMANALEGANISYRGQLQGIGFQAATTNGGTAGIPGQNRRLEALQIWSPLAPTVSVCYQAHVQDQGWQAPKCDGDLIGTVGQGLRMEALQITLPARGSFTRVRYRANVEGVWQALVSSDVACTASNAAGMCGSGLCFNGRCAVGTIGQSKKIEGAQIFLE